MNYVAWLNGIKRGVNVMPSVVVVTAEMEVRNSAFRLCDQGAISPICRCLLIISPQ